MNFSVTKHLTQRCSKHLPFLCRSPMQIETNIYTNLTFVRPRIVIYFYSKTNQMQNISNLFYFGITLYMFRTVFPPIIRSLRLYIQHHTIQVLWLLASKQPQNLCDTSIYLMLYVSSQTPDDGRKNRPKYVDCCSKIK